MKSCDFCGNKASVFLTQLIEGEMKKVTLCDKCAAEKGVTDPTGFSLAEMLLGNISDQKVSVVKEATKSASTSKSNKKCPSCGFTSDDLQRIRRIGCAVCYNTFRSEIDTFIRGMHTGVTHKGKVPAGLHELFELGEMLDGLKGKLDAAVKSEDYEAAAEIQKEIKTLEKKNKVKG